MGLPRVVIVGLASDFGCQVQMTNIEDDLLAVLGRMDLRYWQLASSGHMPEEYDVAVVEGAVTTLEHVELLRRVRETASAVIAIGSCAVTGGIPGMAARGDLDARASLVYGGPDAAAKGRMAPAPVSSVVEVDYNVPGCPIETSEFLHVLGRAVLGLADRTSEQPMCAVCKMMENVCFYERGEVCLGLVTRSGCRAKCVTLGRPCTGCRGIAADANVESARKVLAEHGVEWDEFAARLGLYNSLSEVVA